MIVRACQERNAPLVVIGREWLWERTDSNMKGQGMRVKCEMPDSKGMMPPATTREFWIPFLGPYQLVNATTAVATLDQLHRQGVHLSLEHVSDGLSKTHWPGRLEILSGDPLLVMDGAHNVDSIQRLLTTLLEDLPFDRLVLVAGFSADKDIAGMMRELTSRADQLILTKSIHPRSAEPDQIAARFEEMSTAVTVTSDVSSALWAALELSNAEDLVCVTGSLFVVAEARAAWLDAQSVDFERDPSP